MPDTLSLLILLVSPAVGSFLGVLADRWPRGESVIHPRSACRQCGTRLTAADLVPVLSYAWTRGRCRHCGAAVAPWHLYIELAAIGLAVIAVALGEVTADAAGGTAPDLLLRVALLWTLLALVATDLLWFRLPDLLTGTTLALALALALRPGADPTPAAALAGAGLGVGSFWLIQISYRRLRGRDGLGLGDVKLMTGLGALSGPLLLPYLVLWAALGALAAALLERRTDPTALNPKRPLPFGAALALSGMAIWIWMQLPHGAP